MDPVPDPAPQVDISATRAPKDTKLKSSDAESGDKPPRPSSVPGNNNGLTMEDVSLNPQSQIPIQVVPLESDNRSLSMVTVSDDHNSFLTPAFKLTVIGVGGEEEVYCLPLEISSTDDGKGKSNRHPSGKRGYPLDKDLVVACSNTLEYLEVHDFPRQYVGFYSHEICKCTLVRWSTRQ